MVTIPTPGTIALVGAGPGDPELLTLRAHRLIRAARLIVHDGLVAPAILALASPTARLISVAKARGRHSMAQDAINALLVHEARAGHDVVRLKGGDPFLFGRGGEEVEAARAAGIPVTIVPGITSGSGCAAATQIPLTHRGVASAVSFVAGQCRGLAQQDWAGLAGHGRTLVIYMGLANAGAIADKLIADGLAPDTRVAVVENGTRRDMRALSTLLADLGDMVVREQVQSPALIIVGEVTRHGLTRDAMPMIRALAGIDA